MSDFAAPGNAAPSPAAEPNSGPKHSPLGIDPDFSFPVRNPQRVGFWKALRALFRGKA